MLYKPSKKACNTAVSLSCLHLGIFYCVFIATFSKLVRLGVGALVHCAHRLWLTGQSAMAVGLVSEEKYNYKNIYRREFASSC